MDNRKSNSPEHNEPTKKEEKGHIREGQEDSSIRDNDHIKHKTYPETSLRDKQLDNQEEFITPPNQHPPKDS